MPLPETCHDSFMVAKDRADRECPVCSGCIIRFKPVIVRLERV